ncbi:alpha-amylase family protein [Terrarubrum flagellatum]|uniref:alpha-amylase family protein n=1 Tax=Terrirubrum flagellatum TaxID=2895980 RepID=UPI0031454C46
MRYRQIHLDFHTSERIPGIGSKFDPDDFARTLAAANVDSITVFSKCHHGMTYHPTKVGMMHPHLDFDLMRAQLDALHKHDIRAPIYISAAWDEYIARTEPGWRVISPEGSLVRSRTEALGAGWAFLDFSSPYLDYLCRQVEEVMINYPDGDGIFIDICFQLVSLSAWAQTRMEAQGLDWTNEEDRVTYTEKIQLEFFERVTDAVRKHDPKMRLFYNFGHIRRGRRDILKYFSHLEIESLPTSHWGYEHFPVSARYVDTLGIEFLGHTGKFHHTWGEVGGYKKPDALFYECGAMLAQGSRCLIGDHLHPTGAIDKTTYNAVGVAYAHVKACEPWAVDSKNRAEIGILSTEAARRPRLAGRPTHHDGSDDGVARLLLEGKFTFDFLDSESDFSGYRLIILPDSIEITPALKAKVASCVERGARVLLTGKSGIDSEKGFVFDVGAKWEGTSPNKAGDYLLPSADLRASFVNHPLFMYAPSERIKVTDGKSLGVVHDPYFDRTPAHFSGHVHTPPQPESSGYDAGVEKGGYVYLAHPFFDAYKRIGAVAMMEIAEKAVAHALGRRRMIETNLPRAGRATLRRQARENRDVLHLLHATPALRGFIRNENVQPIQDLVTLHDIDASIETDRPVKSVRLAPFGDALPFDMKDGRVLFRVPRLRGHAMIEIAY